MSAEQLTRFKLLMLKNIEEPAAILKWINETGRSSDELENFYSLWKQADELGFTDEALEAFAKDIVSDGGRLVGEMAGNGRLVEAWKAFLDEGYDALRKDPDALKALDDAVAEGLDGMDAIQDAIQTLNRHKWEEIKALFKRGNDFNRKARDVYDYNEIVLGNGKRLDTYIPGEKIISRKATDLDNIQESTWRNYCNELITKYKIGTPVNSTKLPGEPPLSGKYFIEIPASNQSAQNLAFFRNIAKNEYGIEDIIFLTE